MARWRVIEDARSTITLPFYLVLCSWLVVIFGCFGFITPHRNGFLLGMTALAAISVSSAMFVILDMDTPIGGLIAIGSAPLRDALAHLTAEDEMNRHARAARRASSSSKRRASVRRAPGRSPHGPKPRRCKQMDRAAARGQLGSGRRPPSPDGRGATRQTGDRPAARDPDRSRGAWKGARPGRRCLLLMSISTDKRNDSCRISPAGRESHGAALERRQIPRRCSAAPAIARGRRPRGSGSSIAACSRPGRRKIAHGHGSLRRLPVRAGGPLRLAALPDPVTNFDYASIPRPLIACGGRSPRVSWCSGLHVRSPILGRGVSRRPRSSP